MANVTSLRSADASRDRIHAEALRLFGRFGFEGTSLQMIAGAAGLHKSTLFHHYRNKLELALEVFEAVLERVVAELGALERTPSRIDDLLTCVDALTDWLTREPDAARLLMSFITAPEESALIVPPSAKTAELERRLFAALFGWFERARRAGAIRQLNVRQAVANLIGLVLFYPAVATTLGGGDVAGAEPFSAKAVKVRKAELRALIGCMLAP
jgi:AcrR family transcriptional regulator